MSQVESIFDIVINVTQRDIELGEQKVCEKCPIARATRRVLRKFFPDNAYAVQTGQECSYVYSYNLGKTIAIVKPNSQIQQEGFVTGFDSNKANVKPEKIPATVNFFVNLATL